MVAKEVTESGALVQLTLDELLTVSNALNEICNALQIDEFSTRIGVDRTTALSLLKNVGLLYDDVAKRQALVSS